MFYRESSAADIFQRLTLARKLAVESNLKATEKGKEYHDRKTKPHTYSIGQKVLLEEYYFLGKNAKLAPKWSGPHLILSLKGTHNVELLINDKKKVIVNVDRIKPYRIQKEPYQPDEDSRMPTTLKNATTQYEFDGEKFVSSPPVTGSVNETNAPTPGESTPMPLQDEISNHPDPSLTDTRKRGRPRKVDQAKTTPKRNKWSLEAQAPSTSRMTTRVQVKQSPEEAIATLRTSIPCFCGNQRILKNHSWNCKQQIFNWVSTGDPYTWGND
jgi:hypothetical protein